MDTFDTSGGSLERTAPTPPRGLDFAGQLSFERVRGRLGLASPQDGAARRIGEFEIRGTPLGEGGMGIVYLARDPALGREVAIKLIQTQRHLSPETLRARLDREGRALAQLSHPNVVSVHARGEHEGEPYLVMAYVEGYTLSEWREACEPSDDELLRAHIDAGRGLAAAHAAGIIHRDFKPENVLVAKDGRVQVSDFGLADLLSEPEPQPHTAASRASAELASDERLTKAGEVLGTPRYMAPEQLRGEAADARSDQYAYCTTLWQALTGELPFRGATTDELIAAALTKEPEGGGELPHWLRKLLRRGLASDPAHRHADMRTLVEALERGRGRRGRLLLGGSFFVTVGLAVGLTAFVVHDPGAVATTSCELRERLGPAPDWGALRARLGDASHRVDALATRWRSLDTHAQALCAEGSPAEREHALAWLAQLELAFERPEGSAERLEDYIESLLDRSWDQAPSRPLTPKVRELLTEVRALELDNKLREAAAMLLGEANCVAPRGEAGGCVEVRGVDLAELELQSGRLLMLAGDYEAAELAYRHAAAAADADADDGIRLRALLRVAEIDVKRLEQLERGKLELEAVEGVLARSAEPWISEQRASYHNLRAVIGRLEGDFSEALREQWRALGLLALSGAPTHVLARGVLALGVIYESRGDLPVAAGCFRLVLDAMPNASPDRAQAAFSLGRLLVSSPTQWAEAKALLREAIAARPELRLAGWTELANLELRADEIDEIALASFAEELEGELDAGGGTPSNRASAWQTLSFIYAADARPSERFERAIERCYALMTSELDIAAFELTVAGMSDDTQQQRAFAAKACARLEPLEPFETGSDEEQQLEGCRELLREDSG